MLHIDAKSLVEQGDRLFTQKRVLDTRNQEIADQFYPERADFTVVRNIGEDWADHLMTGYPSMVRRDLGNAFSSMLRPSSKAWFQTGVQDDVQLSHEGKGWLQWSGGVQRRAMYDRVTNFTRATKEGDHDFAAFGGTCISVEMNRRDMALLYRCWHLRDVAYAEDAYGQIGEVHRNWKPTVRDVASLFGTARIHSKMVERLEQEPHAKVDCRHIVIRTDAYGAGKRFRTPWVSLYVDCENEHIIEEVGSWTRRYVLPRWATISGSQYPFSPATLIALPDARLIQAMTLTLLEAGEKSVNPPMVGVREAIRGDLQIYAGGFTAIDREYDEKTGEVLRPLSVDKSGLPFGIDVSDRMHAMMRESFYLNTLSMPPQGGPQMTAFEVGQRVQEYIRQAMPLFEPMEHEYNGELCEMTFEILMREGAFGPLDTIPRELQGADVQFRFESPLADAIEREKGQLFLEAQSMVAATAEADPATLETVDFGTTLRDVLEGIGVPAKWMRSEDEVKDRIAAREQQEKQAAMLAQMQQGAEVAETLGKARTNLAA